jgi:hypothetical protein
MVVHPYFHVWGEVILAGFGVLPVSIAKVGDYLYSQISHRNLPMPRIMIE